MGLTPEAQILKERFEQLAKFNSDPKRTLLKRIENATDSSFHIICVILKDKGLSFKPGWEDESIELVAHIFNYICRSNDLDPMNFPLSTDFL